MSGQRTQWNEATRVQMPALVHLTRIGFTYFGKITEEKAGTVYDPDTNILIEVFKSQFAKLNPERAGEAEAMLRIIRQELDNDDIGESFYKRLKAVSPVRLIDFEHPENNTFHCSAEFTCKRDEDEFRPDITLFVNGLPLVFIEVKKPNNIGGMVAEAERMNKLRFPNKKFRRFINITQLMIFSNNMEYDAMGGIVPIQGVFYCTGSKKGSPFNCFREENPLNLDVAPYNRDFPYKDIDPEVEKQILSDFNNQVIHTSPEYQTNLRTTTPTNRVLTSMCSPDRLLFLLKYGITYYHKTKELDDGTIEQIDQKHIMRYQQFFAAMIVRERISEGTTSGIIWHTQGSGKTALSFHLSYVLTDYFASINKVTKFYFIVDRLDLMKQSKEEFTARGLVVKTASSRAELMEQFRTNQSQEGTTGEPEITVVNIQRFEERQDKVVLPSYATKYILFQKEKLHLQVRKVIFAFIPKQKADAILNICSLTYRTFANFLAGQCLEAVILGMMFVITLSILKMPYALLIGILIAFTALVPIFGAFIGCAVGSFLIFMVNPKQAVLFIIVFLLLQQIEGNLIYPHVVGGSVGLPSIWVLAAVTIGGNLMGIIGMLIFIPLVSVFYTIFREFVYLRLKKQHIKRVTRTDVEEYAEEEIASSFIVPNEK